MAHYNIVLLTYLLRLVSYFTATLLLLGAIISLFEVLLFSSF